MHRMQILADFEPPKFRSEGRPARKGASRKGARPCPQRVLAVVRNPHTFPCDTNCMDPSVQGSWAVWDGVMRYVDELPVYGVLRSS
jgi:hypothetical protein